MNIHLTNIYSKNEIIEIMKGNYLDLATIYNF